MQGGGEQRLTVDLKGEREDRQTKSPVSDARWDLQPNVYYATSFAGLAPCPLQSPCKASPHSIQGRPRACPSWCVTLPHLCHSLEGVIVRSHITGTGRMVSTLVRVAVATHASAGMDEQVPCIFECSWPKCAHGCGCVCPARACLHAAQLLIQSDFHTACIVTHSSSA